MLCHKMLIASVIFIVVEVIFTFSEAKSLPTMITNKQRRSLKWTPVPWLGVVTLSGNYKNANIGLIPVILITDKKAIADARSMASLNKYNWKKIRNYTHVMFLSKKSEAWYANIEKFILHPEYNDETLTTVALLKLEYDLKKFEGDMLKWPFKFSKGSHTNVEVFAIGYTNRSRIYEQNLYRMDYVKLGECETFYYAEDIDTKWMRPKRYHCYTVRFSKQTCVFEPGMALVQYDSGKYTLMGFSVWGPGCSLPARFVDLEPFVTWIVTNMGSTRRNLLNSELMRDRPEKFRDRWVLHRLTDQSLALRPLIITEDKEVETVHGSCDSPNTRRDQLIYTEVTEFTTRRGPNRRKIRGVAVYGLSLFDKDFNKTHYTCIEVMAKCKQKSDSRLDYTKSFETDSFAPYVKTLAPMNYKDVYPPFVYTIKDIWDRYDYEVIGTDITHLIFRFEFEVYALIEVTFFGNRTDKYPITTPTTTVNYAELYSCTRWRRPYKVSTRVPHRGLYEEQEGVWFVKMKNATRSRTFKSTTTTTKRKRSTRTLNPNQSTNWWNKWWHLHREPPPFVEKDWWKG